MATRGEGRQRQGANVLLGHLPVMLEQRIGETRGQRHDFGAGQGDDGDGADVERVHAGEMELHRHLRAHVLVHAPEGLEHGDDGKPEASLGEEAGKVGRAMLVGGEAEDARGRVQMGPDEFERAAVKERVTTSWSGQPRRAAARLKADGAG